MLGQPQSDSQKKMIESFVGLHEPGVSVYLTTPTQSTFFVCLQVFCQAGPPQLVDSLASIRNKRKVSFQGQRRVTRSAVIKPGVDNLSIINLTLYQLSYLRLLSIACPVLKN